MTKAVLKFKTLAEMAAYSKQIRLDAFIMDTEGLTLKSIFYEPQIATAIRDYHASCWLD